MRHLLGIILLALGLALFLFLSFAQAGEVVEPVSLKEDEGLKASFKQERYLTGFDGAIESTGVMYLMNDDDLVWDVLDPFPSRLIIDDDEVTHIVDGQTTFNVPTSKFPALKNMQEVISASLKGDWAILAEKFGKAPHVESMGWSLNLTETELPEDFPFAIFDIQGGEFVDFVTMTRKNGDRDEIALFDHEILTNDILEEMIETD